MNKKDNCDHSKCNTTNPNPSLAQTISEMDWEKGIWCAAFNGDKDKIQYLLQKSMIVSNTVNAPDNSGYTALHYAARNGHLDICKMLIQNGANINAATRSGKATPLHKAAAAGNTTAVTLLIKAGAAVELQDVDGETALHKASKHNNYNLIRVLLDACPHLYNIKDNKGNSAVTQM
ncbi:hypothetical protein ACJJTC_009934 [Scirpophaga incertulas]